MKPFTGIIVILALINLGISVAMHNWYGAGGWLTATAFSLKVYIDEKLKDMDDR